MTETQREKIANLRLELRRGMLVLAALSQMSTARYGYSLIQKLSEQGLEIEEGTLYPLLRRLEKQGILISEWDTTESRPRKYYQLGEEGREVLAALKADWLEIVDIMQRLLSDQTGESGE